MGNGLIAFMAAIGAAGWVYSKISKRTGGSATKSASTAAIIGALVFMIMMTILSLA